MIIRTYSELIKFDTFLDRLNYLQLKGVVGKETFGFDRYFNQKFYKSYEWERIRNEVIVRDMGCDLGIIGYDIFKGTPIYIHHMNPINLDDIINVSEYLLNPEYLITTTLKTHNAIHYGVYNEQQIQMERRANDTCPWKIKKEETCG